MRKLFVVFGMIVTLAVPGQILAAHPLVTDDAETVGRGGALLEFNSEFGFDRETVEGVRNRARGGEVAAVGTYGLTDDLDLVLEVPYQWSRIRAAGETVYEEDGLADLTIELKWRLFQAERGAYALKPAVVLPTGDEDKGLGKGKVSFGLTFIASREFEPVDLHLNVGYIRNEFKLKADREENRRDLWHVSVAAVRSLTDRLDLVGDIGIERNGERGSNRHPAFALAGLIYSVTDNLDVDFGVKVGLTGAETDFSVLTGVALSF
jgi:hypothetical protein